MAAKLKKEILEWLKALILAAVVVGILSVFITPTMVYSVSMYPTLVEKDLLILKKGNEVAKGDIVSCQSELYLTAGDLSHMNVLQRQFDE